MIVTARATWLALILVALSGATLSSCGKLNLSPSGGGGGPTPTSSASTSPTPGVCATLNPASNTVVVAMSSSIAAVGVPTFGPIGGYSVVNLNDGTFPQQATVIKQFVNANGSPSPITSNNVLQFANADSAYGPNHSAVGFKGDAFPGTPHVFASPLALPVGTAISNNTTWSTGRIAAPFGNYTSCLSKSLTLKQGTYFFGDLDFYNITTFRDVLIVGTPAPRDVRYLKGQRRPNIPQSAQLFHHVE